MPKQQSAVLPYMHLGPMGGGLSNAISRHQDIYGKRAHDNHNKVKVLGQIHNCTLSMHDLKYTHIGDTE